MVLQRQSDQTDESTAGANWPPQVDLILSALEIGRQQARVDRRVRGRSSFRVRGRLRLFSDQAGGAPWTIYTRDVHTRGLGFITPHRLPLGYGGMIEFPGPDGRMLNLHCTLLRCREAAPGWYDCSVYFNRQRPEFRPTSSL